MISLRRVSNLLNTLKHDWTRRVRMLRHTISTYAPPCQSVGRQVPPVRSHEKFSKRITCGPALGAPDGSGGPYRKG